jgi:hypothetical protein
MRISAKYLGSKVVFLGFDGKTYDGKITAIYPRGFQITYPVAVQGVMRDCTANLVTKEHRNRVIVQA